MLTQTLSFVCNILLCSLITITVHFLGVGCKDQIRPLFKLFGPGLTPNVVVMPARYIFVVYREEGNQIGLRNHLPSVSDLKIVINGHNKYQRDCRIWTNILDRKDGSFIIRYKLYETCYNVKINVKFKGVDIGDSPYQITGVVQPEDCYCPFEFEEWLESNQCPPSYSQVAKDLEHFQNVNFSTFHNNVVKKIDKSGSMSVCNYVIKDNEIYRKCYGQHVGFKMFMDATLTSLARRMRLPDLEMFVNLGDWPLVPADSEKIFPMFSWCGSKQSLDIVMPTYDITESSLEMMGRVSLDMLSVQGNIELPWEEKEPRVFWRGRDASRERLKLIEISRQHPELFNTSLTNFFFFRDQEHIYGPKTQHVSFFEFFKYKYLVNLDGTVAPYRTPYLLAGDSLMLKQDSDYYEHYYGELRAWTHFVPVKRDLSDLVHRVRWALTNDQEARNIALAGQQFARNNLLPQHIFCYHAVLLKEWRKRLVGEVKIRKGMEKVPQTETKDSCICPSKKTLKDEL